MVGHNGQHAIHFTVNCLTSGCLCSSVVLFTTWRIYIASLPFSITMAIGAHSYRIRSFPLGLFLSAGYAKIPPYSSVRYASATMLPMYRALYGLPPSLGRFKLSKYSLTGSSQYHELPS